MKLDPLKMKDWEIADAASENMKTVLSACRGNGAGKDGTAPLRPFYRKT